MLTCVAKSKFLFKYIINHSPLFYNLIKCQGDTANKVISLKALFTAIGFSFWVKRTSDLNEQKLQTKIPTFLCRCECEGERREKEEGECERVKECESCFFMVYHPFLKPKHIRLREW